MAGSLRNRIIALTGPLNGIAALARSVAIRRHQDDDEHGLRAARAVVRSTRFCTLVTDGPSLSRLQWRAPFRPDEHDVVRQSLDAMLANNSARRTWHLVRRGALGTTRRLDRTSGATGVMTVTRRGLAGRS